MLKRLVNEVRFTLVLETQGPLLIKSGHTTLAGSDMAPVVTHRNGRSEVYIPGSSLKGTLRSHIEKVGRTLNNRTGPVCNPFQQDRQAADQSCSFRLIPRRDERDDRDEEPRMDQHYPAACAICRLFGCTAFIGRVSIGDAYLTEPLRALERRDGVGIDRLTGGAFPGAKFDLEAVPSGVRFAAPVALRNFESYQLGALLLAVTDLQDGVIRLGSGRSRGLGWVKGWIAEEAPVDPPGLSVATIGTPTPPGEVWGLGRFLADGSYGTQPDDVIHLSGAGLPQPERRGARHVTAFTGVALSRLAQAAQEVFVERLQRWPARPPGTTGRNQEPGPRGRR